MLAITMYYVDHKYIGLCSYGEDRQPADEPAAVLAEPTELIVQLPQETDDPLPQRRGHTAPQCLARLACADER